MDLDLDSSRQFDDWMRDQFEEEEDQVSPDESEDFDSEDETESIGEKSIEKESEDESIDEKSKDWNNDTLSMHFETPSDNHHTNRPAVQVISFSDVRPPSRPSKPHKHSGQTEVSQENPGKPHSLLSEIEAYAASQLHGKDRHVYLHTKLQETLGHQRKRRPNSTKPLLSRIPLKMTFGMLEKARHRAQKQREAVQASDERVIASSQMRASVSRLNTAKNKEEQVWFAKDRHPLAENVQRENRQRFLKKAAGEERRLERGLKVGIGKFKNGVLQVSERDVKRIEREGVKKAERGRSGQGHLKGKPKGGKSPMKKKKFSGKGKRK